MYHVSIFPEVKKMYWLIIGNKSQLLVENKLLLYKVIQTNLNWWAYGIQLWGMVSNSNIKIL